MSKIHRDSAECALLNLELTSLPMTCTSIDDVIYNEIQSANSLGDSEIVPVEFHIAANQDYYTDLGNTELYLKTRVVHEDGTVCGIDDIVTPINNFGHSLFKEMSVTLNDILVTKTTTMYPFKAYLQNTLNFGESAKESWLQSCLYFPDAHGDAFDQTDSVKGSPLNAGAMNRYSYAKDSKIIDMIFRPCIDLFHQDRPLLPTVDIKLKMTRSSSRFCLMAHDPGQKRYKVQILQASLVVRQVRLNESIAIAHQTALHRGISCKYPIARTECLSFTIGASVLDVNKANVINGLLPHTLVIGLTGNDSFHGAYNRSPFNFRPFDLSAINLIVNGRSYPTKVLEPNFNNGSLGKQYIRCYNTLFRGTVRQYADCGNMITRAAFESGYTIFVIRLAEDVSPFNFGLTRHGNVGLRMAFNTSTPETLNCVIMAEYRNVMEINKAGEIMFDYQA